MKVMRCRSIGIGGAALRELGHMDFCSGSSGKVRGSCWAAAFLHDVSLSQQWHMGPSVERQEAQVA